MKKPVLPIIVAALLIALTFNACDNAATAPEADGDDLVGLWTVTSVASTNCDDPDENRSLAAICTTTDCLKVQLGNDGTFVSTDLEDGVTTTYTGTYTVSGSQITITEGMDVQVATYMIEDGVLTFVGEESETGCDVSTTLIKGS